jgi:hypothetical protein
MINRTAPLRRPRPQTGRRTKQGRHHQRQARRRDRTLKIHRPEITFARQFDMNNSSQVSFTPNLGQGDTIHFVHISTLIPKICITLYKRHIHKNSSTNQAFAQHHDFTARFQTAPSP